MPRHREPGLLAVLHQRDFRLLISAFTVSFAGSWAYNVALVVLVWDRTHSAAWMGAATFGRFVPSIVFGPYGGVIAERFERVRLMVRLDLFGALINVGLAAVAITRAPILLAIALGAISSSVQTIYQPATAAVTPQTVPEKQLAAANTLRNTVDNLAIIVGPAVAGLLLLVGPPSITFFVNAATFVWSALILSRMSVRSEPVDVTEQGTAGPFAQMIVGVRTISAHSTAAVLAAFGLASSFVYGIDTVQFVLVSHDQLGTGASGVSYLLAGLGVGGILGAGLVNRLSASRSLGLVIMLGMVVLCAPTLLLLTLHSPAAGFVIEVVRGAGWMAVDVLTVTALQRVLPDDRIARAFGAFFTGAIAATVLGAMAVPVVLRVSSFAGTLWFAGAVVPAVCALGWPWLRSMDAGSVSMLAELEHRVSVLRSAGILAQASRQALESLASTATELVLPIGRDVVREGEAADAFYVIEDGSVSVHPERGAPHAELAILARGDYFGEVGLLDGTLRIATVSTVTPCRLLRVEAERFLEALSTGAPSSGLLERARTRRFATTGITGSLRRVDGPHPLSD